MEWPAIIHNLRQHFEWRNASNNINIGEIALLGYYKHHRCSKTTFFNWSIWIWWFVTSQQISTKTMLNPHHWLIIRSTSKLWDTILHPCPILKAIFATMWALLLGMHDQLHSQENCDVITYTCLNPIQTISLTHWGRVTHICVVNLTIIASDNGLLPDRRQAIVWSNAGILLIGLLGTNFNEILIEILTFSFKKMHWKVSAKWRPFCLGLNVLTHWQGSKFPVAR